jgi:hypothetical protein
MGGWAVLVAVSLSGRFVIEGILARDLPVAVGEVSVSAISPRNPSKQARAPSALRCLVATRCGRAPTEDDCQIGNQLFGDTTESYTE